MIGGVYTHKQLNWVFILLDMHHTEIGVVYALYNTHFNAKVKWEGQRSFENNFTLITEEK